MVRGGPFLKDKSSWCFFWLLSQKKQPLSTGELGLAFFGFGHLWQSTERWGGNRVAGNRACRRPFRPPSNRPLTLFAAYFSGFVSRRHPVAKPEKFAAN